MTAVPNSPGVGRKTTLVPAIFDGAVHLSHGHLHAEQLQRLTVPGTGPGLLGGEQIGDGDSQRAVQADRVVGRTVDWVVVDFR